MCIYLILYILYIVIYTESSKSYVHENRNYKSRKYVKIIIAGKLHEV